MKMNYLQRSKSKSSYSKKILFLFGVFLFGTILFYLIEPFLIPIFSPVWRADNAVSKTFQKGLNLFLFKQTLIDENILLKERLDIYELELTSLRAKEENFESRTFLGQREELSGILASVLVRPPQSPYDSLIVDAGSQEGVVLGARVSMLEGSVIGIVSEIFQHQARVKLVTTSGEKTNAILERHGVPVLLEGVGGGNFHIKVPRETEVVVGDRILSAGLDASLVAIVGDISIQATDSFKKVLARSPISIFTIRFVEILP